MTALPGSKYVLNIHERAKTFTRQSAGGLLDTDSARGDSGSAVDGNSTNLVPLISVVFARERAGDASDAAIARFMRRLDPDSVNELSYACCSAIFSLLERFLPFECELEWVSR